MPERVGGVMKCSKCGCNGKCESNREMAKKVMDQNVDLINLCAALKKTIEEKNQIISKLLESK
jgi:hypothetical protein